VLYLIRHGHTGANALHELHGLDDDDLDDAGRAQADALGRLFTGLAVAAVYASPLRRAVETAAPVAASTGHSVEVDRALVDRDYGPWTGRLKTDVAARFGSIDAAPGVEPWDAFTDRSLGAFLAVAQRHQGDRAVVVAHDAVNQAVLWRLFPERWPGAHAIPQRNGCWNELVRDGDGWELVVLDALPGDGQQPGAAPLGL
jgi:probable phosphoglycerate mutase